MLKLLKNFVQLSIFTVFFFAALLDSTRELCEKLIHPQIFGDICALKNDFFWKILRKIKASMQSNKIDWDMFLSFGNVSRCQDIFYLIRLFFLLPSFKNWVSFFWDFATIKVSSLHVFHWKYFSYIDLVVKNSSSFLETTVSRQIILKINFMLLSK